MGKNLHYSIRPFIEKALKNHHNVISLESIQDPEYYAYKINRRNMNPITVVLSDAYYLGAVDLESKPELLKDGGYYLKARPEGSVSEDLIPNEKLGIGSLRLLMSVLNKDDFWNWVPPKKKNQ